MILPKSSRSVLAVALLALGLPFGAAVQGAGGGTSGGPTAPAPQPGTPTPTPSGPSVEPSRDAPGASLSPQERHFIEKAARDGIAEVELGKLAQEKGGSPQVREFGEVMVRDHGEANEELEQLAEEKGIALPASLDTMHQQAMQDLQKRSDTEFDRAYIDRMLANHRASIADFERQSTQGDDIALKSFAAKNLLILQEHLKMAQTIERNLQGNRAGYGASRTERTNAPLPGSPRQ